jgi:hypothetical protein
MTAILVNFDPANAQRLCWSLNALLQKISGGNRFGNHVIVDG